MCGGGVRSILLLPLVAKCLETIDVCISYGTCLLSKLCQSLLPPAMRANLPFMGKPAMQTHWRQASTNGNQRTVCVAIDLTAAFDTVSHGTLISKIAGFLPPSGPLWALVVVLKAAFCAVCIFLKLESLALVLQTGAA